MFNARPCPIHGCKGVSKTFSPLCPNHRRHLRRNGHPEQAAIKVTELRPFVALLARRQEDNKDSKAWVILRERWSRLLQSAAAAVAEKDAGEAHARATAQASQLLLDVGKVACPDEVIRTAMAVVMLRQAVPHRFQSDRAVHFQVVRQVLRLAPQEMPRYWDHKKQTMRSVRKEHSARTLEVIGHQLVEAFGGAAVQLHHLEKTRRPPEVIEAEQLQAALEGLTASSA